MVHWNRWYTETLNLKIEVQRKLWQTMHKNRCYHDSSNYDHKIYLKKLDLIKNILIATGEFKFATNNDGKVWATPPEESNSPCA